MLKNKSFILWLLTSLALAGWLGVNMFGEDKSEFMPGPTISGHAQFAVKCDACHTTNFTSKDELQDACTHCHAAELKAADDSHPRSKFTDPRNASVIKKVEATYCVTCHKEHVPEQTRAMGVTLPDDVCFNCHQEIAEDRPSHKNFDFMSCASAGCHNFHDNKALYEDFLVKHGHEPALLQTQKILNLNFIDYYKTVAKHPVKTLAANDAIQSGKSQIDPKILHDWSETSHAAAGVNCINCHSKTKTSEWIDKPDHNNCKQCHTREADTFMAGKHGLRLSLELSPMTPAQSDLPMKDTSAHKELNCMSCHSAHRFNTRTAAIDSCLSCHDDRHSLAFKSSPHNQANLKNTSNTSGSTLISCATCHMPREQGDDHVFVNHNQNRNLQPNEKMIRTVCMNCHGLGFSIDALADSKLIDTNFKGKPSKHIESIDLALERLKPGNKRK